MQKVVLRREDDRAILGVVQCEKRGWVAHHIPSSPWLETHPGAVATFARLEDAQDWLMAQTPPPRPQDLMPGVVVASAYLVWPVWQDARFMLGHVLATDPQTMALHTDIDPTYIFLERGLDPKPLATWAPKDRYSWDVGHFVKTLDWMEYEEEMGDFSKMIISVMDAGFLETQPSHHEMIQWESSRHGREIALLDLQKDIQHPF